MLGTLSVVIGALMFSSQVIFGKILVGYGFSGLDLSFFQYGFGVIAIILFVLVSGKSKHVLNECKGNFLKIALMGFFSVASTTSMFMALETLNAGIASMLLFTSPVFVCLFFMISGIKKIGVWNKLALFLAVIGSVLVLNIIGVSSNEISLIGILFGVASSISYAGYCIYYDLKASKYSIITTTCVIQIVAFALVSVIHFDVLANHPDITVQSMLLAAIMSIFCNVTPIFFLFKGMIMIGSEKASIIGVSELPSTLIIAFLVLGETMDILQVVGILFVILAVLVLQKEN